MENIKESETYHFIGIGGIGMSALACILLDRQIEVTGSDLASSYVTEMLENCGAKITIGHASENVKPGSVTIYATGVPENNPELSSAKKFGNPLLHRSDLLKSLAGSYQMLAVTGTHGKTTTSALLSHVLKSANYDPAFAVGGVLPQYARNGIHGRGKYFVVEACESDGSFLKYAPFGAIVTNIDSDHIDFYGSQCALNDAFRTFAYQVSSPESMFWCGDNEILRELKVPGVSYGFGENCRLRILNVFQHGWDLQFDIQFNGKVYKKICLPLIGLHNALNASAVFGLALSLGMDEKDIRQGFLTFKGIKRRCECKGSYGNILLIDDYAHHPEEIKATLNALRSAIGPTRRLVAVYQPHRYTRSRDCLGLFNGVFQAADDVIITEIYGAGEQPIEGISSEAIYQDIAKSKASAKLILKENLIEYLANLLKENDVLVTLGAGDITNLSKGLLTYFKEIRK